MLVLQMTRMIHIFLYQDQTRKKLYCFKQEPEEFGPYDKRYVGMIKNQAELLTFEKESVFCCHTFVEKE